MIRNNDYLHLPNGPILRVARKPKKVSRIRYIFWLAWNLKWDRYARKFTDE